MGPVKRTTQRDLQPAVTTFLESLPDSRRAEVDRVRSVIVEHLPEGYEEAVVKGMLVYQVPIASYPDTYNKHALWYAAIASQKSYLTLHLMPVSAGGPLADKLRAGFAASGRKLNMGKACINFQKADDLDLDTVGEIIAAVPMQRWIEVARSAR